MSRQFVNQFQDTLERMDLLAKRHEKLASLANHSNYDSHVATGIRLAMAVLVDEIGEDKFDNPFINYRIPMLSI